MKTIKTNSWPKFLKKTCRLLIIGLGLVGCSLVAYHLAYLGKIYPGIFIAQVPLGNLTRAQATEKIERLVSQFISSQPEISLIDEQETYVLSLKEISLKYLVQESVQQAFGIGRQPGFLNSLKTKISLWRQPRNLPLLYVFDQASLSTITINLAAEIDTPAIEPTVNIVSGKQGPVVEIHPGQTGRGLNLGQLAADLNQRLSVLSADPLELPFAITSPSLTETEVTSLKNRAENTIGKTITLEAAGQSWLLNDTDLVKFLSFSTFGDGFDRLKIDQYLNQIAAGIDRPSQDAVFQFKEGRAIEFQPDKPGLQLDRSRALRLLLQDLKKTDKILLTELPVNLIEANITTEKVNDLGIKELVAVGESWFRGSVSNRVHNIKTAAAKLNGLLIPPGEEFSFNLSLGEVLAETGYKEAYVIKQGRTIPEIGGGVCQVSTTLFRAALNAGLPITERHAHAYRVGYYEQGFGPGIDATVYSPTADLKFTNNTPHHLLIQTRFDQEKSYLAFDLYGTNDGRQVEITKPAMTQQTLPPPPLYIPDPNLPVGTTKQIEKAIPGAKTIFYERVYQNGELISEDSFPSRFQAWQAIYLEGTKTP